MRGAYVKRRWAHDPTLHAPARYRKACAYEAFIPDGLLDIDLGIGGDLAGLISDAEARIAALNHPSAPALAPLARLLLRTESIASSKVEGMQADARTLARGEVAQDTGRQVGKEVFEILANIDAMQFAIETAAEGKDVTPRSILDIHQVLLARALPARAGRLRETQGWIGGNDYNPCGASYVPPPEHAIEALLEDLCRFCSDDRLPPLVQAAIAHGQFETIHPFDDGNGRTGRVLIQVLLRRRGLAPTFVPPISVVLAEEKDRYIRGLISFREDTVDEWLELFASAAARSADVAQRYLDEVKELQEDWRDQVRQSASPRSDSAVWNVLEVLPGHPVVTVAVAAAALEASGTPRSRAAIQTAVRQLEASGVLQPVSESRRNRAWEATGLLDLVASVDAGS